MKQDHVRWHTPHLSRDFDMLVFGHAGHPVIVFPTAGGRYFELKNSGLIESAAALIDAGRVTLYCPDSIDAQSWHNRAIHPADRVRAHLAYENVIRHDIVPRALHERGGTRVGLAGIAFGGYHAANFAFRYTDLVSHLFCLGGTFDIKVHLDGYYDENCHINSPPDYLRNLPDDTRLSQIRRLAVVLGTGKGDPHRAESLHLTTLLRAKGAAPSLDDQPAGNHDWNGWCEAFPRYLERMAE